jgi:hypothetical protein
MNGTIRRRGCLETGQLFISKAEYNTEPQASQGSRQQDEVGDRESVVMRL